MIIAETMERRAREFVDRYTACINRSAGSSSATRKSSHGVLTCLFVGGHCLLEACRAWANPAGPHPGQNAQPRLQPHPVHPRPDARRHPRHQHGHGNARRQAVLRVPEGTDLHPNLSGRRNQPGHAQNPVGHARNDAGGGHHRGRQRYQLTPPFFVMATQNPIEQEGTYPLPEAQLDRFFFKLLVGYSRPQGPGRRSSTAPPAARSSSRKGDGRGGDHPLAGVGPRGDSGRACPRLRGAAHAGHAPQRAIRAAGYEPVHPLGHQPAGRPGVGAGLEGPGHCWTAATTSASRTSAGCICPPCGTVSSSTSRPRPKGSSRIRCCWSYWRRCRRRRVS